MRRCTFVALFAVFLHAFAPLLAGAAPEGRTYQVELCTAHGVVTIAVDSHGAPVPPAANPDHCQSCAFYYAAPPSAGSGFPAPATTAQVRAVVPPPVRASKTRTASRPRAPPNAA